MPALDGMRVLDFTQYEAGPSCCQYLAWLGADVVKVEPPRGEPGRKTGAPNGGKAQYLENYNANKRSVAVDVSTEAGRDLVRRLVTGFDVFVENQGPRVMEKLGLDPPVAPGRPPVADLRPHQGLRPSRGRTPTTAASTCWPRRRPGCSPSPATPTARRCARRHVRRHRHRRAHCDGDPRRVRAEARTGRGPGDRDEHARGDDDVHPHRPGIRGWELDGEPAAPRIGNKLGGAPTDMYRVPAVRRRTTTSTSMVRHGEDVGGAVQGHRPPRSPRRSALRHRGKDGRCTSPSLVEIVGRMVRAADQARGDDDAGARPASPRPR